MAFVGKQILLQRRDIRTVEYLSYLEYGSEQLVESSEAVEMADPEASFVMEKSKNSAKLVHIRTCYNNKYWARKSNTEFLITASAHEIEEDKTKWSCTLFEPINVVDVGDGNYGLSLRHTQLGRSVVLKPRGIRDVIHLSQAGANPLKLKAMELEKLVILPKHVAFKGDNGCYLSARNVDGHPYLEFAAKNITDPTVGHEVFLHRDGTIRIKSKSFDKFWRRSPNWIWCDALIERSFSQDSRFWPVKLEDNVVALRNLGNNLYCQRLTTGGKTSCLNAAVGSVVDEARLEVEELVLSRRIHNLEFHVDKAKVDVEEVILAVSNRVENVPEERDGKSEVRVGYEVLRSSTWRARVTMGFVVKTTFEASIPLVASGKVEISMEESNSYEWGKTHGTKVTAEATTTVVVPPKSKRRVMVVASKGSCEVPFSYYQTDLCTDGKYVTAQKHDGVYTGVNYYDISSKIVDDSDGH